MPHYGPGVDSASNRNECLGGKGVRCVGLTTLLPSCADCLEVWELQPPGTLRVCTGTALPLLFFSSNHSAWQFIDCLLTSHLIVGGQDSPVLLLRVERSKRDVGIARERGSWSNCYRLPVSHCCLLHWPPERDRTSGHTGHEWFLPALHFRQGRWVST